MVKTDVVQPRHQTGYGETAGISSRGGSGRWVHMWTRNAVAIYSTQSTAAMAKDCMTRDLRGRGAEQRWKSYLALVSHAFAAAPRK